MKKKIICSVIIIMVIIIGTIILFTLGNKNDENSTQKYESKELEIKEKQEGEKIDMKKIKITNNNLEIVFELNDSDAAKNLIEQLPLIIDVENYSNNEKIFYPEKLSTNNTPLADAKKGTLAYYAPWGDVVMYYDDFGSASGLYELGKVISGEDNIEKLSGTITIEIN